MSRIGKQPIQIPGTVKVAVHRLRRRYRELLRTEIANTVASPEEVDGELGELFVVLSL